MLRLLPARVPHLVLGLLLVVGFTPAAAAAASTDYRQVVDITFPVADPQGLSSYIDDYDQPRGGGSRYHKATDIGGRQAYGLPIHAAVGGTITWITGIDGTAVHATAGWAMTIRGDDGRSYSYVHLGRQDGPASEAYASGMRKGVRVERGQHIGYLGHSGNAAGYPHLHFEISQPGVKDPYGTERINPFFSLRAAERRGDLPSGSVARSHGTGFSDVPTSHTHAAGVTWVAERRITTGCGIAGHFCPDRSVTRGQMATFLQRAGDLPDGGAHGFNDVPKNHPHARGIAAVEAAGIAAGVGGGRFDPDGVVRRDQMATFLRRALDLPASTRSYPDVPSSSPHAEAIGAIGDAGITAGYPSGEYQPATPVARAQMATFLQRAYQER